MMENFSLNEVVSNSKMETMVEFTTEDKIALYRIEGQPAPKEEELPAEMITKKFNSRLSLKPISEEIFDDETVLAKLIGEGKKGKK